MFIVLKKKTLILIACCLVVVVGAGVALGVTLDRTSAASATGKKVVVLDAGHGGPDRGVVGKAGTEEAKKNLQIAKMLRSLLTDAGFFVVMTREGDGGANEPVSSFKTEDFKKRKAIIEKWDPDLVVSIHCNKFPSSDRRGAQMFYNGLSAEGERFASCVQSSLNVLNEEKVGRAFTALKGEYYMLNCSFSPSVIVECGFLSNPEDEALLCDEAYLNDLTLCLLGGITDYLDARG